MDAATFLFVTAALLITTAQCHSLQSWESSQRSSCLAMLHSRRQLDAAEQRAVAARASNSSAESFCPAILWTYTGTGNTMTRMLIEVASGWHTGSVYTDLSLVDILPGERVCDGGAGVIAVKAHPQWHSFSSLSPDGFRPDAPGVPPDAKELCRCAYTRAVAVIRDPYNTFLAEYKRLRTHDYDGCSHALKDGQPCRGGHVSVLRKQDFNATDFRVQALRMAREWAAMFESYDAFAAAHEGGLYMTSFEALTRPHTRQAALAGLLAALGVPPQRSGAHAAGSGGAAADAGPGQCAAGGQGGYDPERLACAFEMAAHPHIYRPKDPAGIDAESVYGADAALVCDLWRLVGPRASAHGYEPYGGAHC